MVCPVDKVGFYSHLIGITSGVAVKLHEGGGTTNGCSERRHLRHVPGRAARGEADARRPPRSYPPVRP